MAEGGLTTDDINLPPTAPGQLTWVPTKRGKKQPCLDGFEFQVSQRMANGTTYWRCSEIHCKATLKTTGEEGVTTHFILRGVHTGHGEHRKKVERKRFAEELRRKAKDHPHTKMQEIYKEVVNEREANPNLHPAEESLV